MKFIFAVIVMALCYPLVYGLMELSPALFMLLLAFILFMEGNCGGGCLAVIIFILVLIFA